MSTDIIQYSLDPASGVLQKQFSLPALKLYLVITLPMMAATFVAWYCVYWWINKKDYVKSLKEKLAWDTGGQV